MRLSLSRALVAFILVSSCGFAQAEINTLRSNVRALGMGDAFTAVASDSSALFYNPAGLARVSGINLKFFSVRAGANGTDSIEAVQDFQGAEEDGYSDLLQDMIGEHHWVGAGGEMAFTLPMLGLAVFNHTDALVKIDNPVYPELYTSIINDYGYVLGFGVPVGPIMQMGLNLKYVKRTGARKTFEASSIADLDPDVIAADLTKWGTGYGADLGVNFVLPAPFFSATLSAAWKNIGRMEFRSEDTATRVPYEDNDVTLGAALAFDTPILSITPAVDYRYLNRSDLQLTRKLNFGIEIGLPLIDIRGGFREGYYTAGGGVNLGLFRVDAATYGVELGEYPGQLEDRRYVVEFTMELGIGGFSASGSSGGGSGSGGRSGSGKSKSLWGTRKLKQRR